MYELCVFEYFDISAQGNSGAIGLPPVRECRLARSPAAVYRQSRAGHLLGRVRGQENRGAPQLLGRDEL